MKNIQNWAVAFLAAGLASAAPPPPPVPGSPIRADGFGGPILGKHMFSHGR